MNQPQAKLQRDIDSLADAIQSGFDQVDGKLAELRGEVAEQQGTLHAVFELVKSIDTTIIGLPGRVERLE